MGYKHEYYMPKPAKWCDSPGCAESQPCYKSYGKPKKKYCTCEEEYSDKCHVPTCGEDNRLAEAYVVWQKYERAFSPREALEKGTLFPELYKPCFKCG